jgi:hypothetical protein
MQRVDNTYSKSDAILPSAELPSSNWNVSKLAINILKSIGLMLGITAGCFIVGLTIPATALLVTGAVAFGLGLILKPVEPEILATTDDFYRDSGL